MRFGLAVGVAVGAFVGTNIDGMVMLVALFASHSDRRVHRRIIAGEFSGFAIIVAISAAVAWALLPLRGQYLGWLGVVPMALGARGLAKALTSDGTTTVRTAAISTCRVMLLTLSAGGDNISVYSLLFRRLGAGFALLASVVFAVLLAGLCIAGRRLPSLIGRNWPRTPIGALLGPTVMLVVGVSIFLRAGAAGWITQSVE